MEKECPGEYTTDLEDIKNALNALYRKQRVKIERTKRRREDNCQLYEDVL